jgi:hypothetical protein
MRKQQDPALLLKRRRSLYPIWVMTADFSTDDPGTGEQGEGLKGKCTGSG